MTKITATSCTAYIGLGGNLGDREATLRRAIALLDQTENVEIREVSDFIETEPVGPADQPEYLNAVVEIATSLSPEELLTTLQAIEAELGRDRKREQRWGPRTCDMDILLMGECVMKTTSLTIPHPRLSERGFVLRPLAQIAPQAVHPIADKTIAELLAALEAGQ